MNGFLDLDSKFFTVLGRVADLLWLNILCLLCCLPIITAGASVTALYYVTLKMVRNEEAYITKSFFRAFKENFRQATIIWIVLLFSGIIILTDLYVCSRGGFPASRILYYILLALLAVYSITLAYVFPTLARFGNTIKNTLKNSLMVSIANLPKTLLILFITIGPLALLYLMPAGVKYGLLFYSLLGLSVVAYLNSIMLRNIFEKFE